ncbi:hypothetical protein [Flavobacterium sp. T12S277]|uniref:hypothetical protein n=1 Tax=Flavobacterium sp. T12S277 TaxID=3402752 RepID=UPI003AEA66B3
MINDTIIKNGIGLMKMYLPNLFEYISEKEFEQFLRKSYNHSEEHGGGTPNNNFLVTFFKLIEEHYINTSSDIRNEFGYFNFLLDKFLEFGNNKNFKSLILAALNNFKSSNFKHVLGEIAACVDLSSKANFLKYEKVLDNGKSIDFHFEKQKHNFYVDVVSFDFDIKKYEKENFKKFLDGRLLQKFESKSTNLNNKIKEHIVIYPILYGFTVKIIKEQEEYLKSIHLTRYLKNGFQSFEPKCFGNIQGTFFNLFSIDQIVNFEKYYK